ncbi:hypothetical protein [Metabacillus fastidiosus]|uniref:hypothetical protein n=1 Tax=Metabacillus fastidiosus TaxID=1458 RepID=UPI002E1F348D|nr:hypothetical protein [Metabacillus fastidiosus]
MFFWEKKDEQFIIDNVEKMTDSEIALELNRTTNAVRYKRLELGLFRQSQKRTWQEWEKEYLKENFYDEEEGEICRVLHPRIWETIRAYATKNLKLKRRNKCYKYQVSEGMRKCKKCGKILEENTENFYKDGNGFRLLCIPCYNDEQEKKAREQGIMTRKLVQEMFSKGLSHCGRCKSWKSIYEFRKNHNDLNQLHRWCEECEKRYLKEYHLKKKYGENYDEIHLEENEELIDLNGVKWRSTDEKYISNWLIINEFEFDQGPSYKEVFNENSKRQFDWIVKINGQNYLVEYFGWWGIKSRSRKFVEYNKKAKRKIRKMYKNRHKYNFIIIFPIDWKKRSCMKFFQ